MSVSSFFGAVALDVSKAAHAVKSELLKLAGEAPQVAAVIDKYGGEVAAVLGGVGFPQAAAFESVIQRLADAGAKAVEDAGEAAGANGLSVPIDQQLAADIKALVPAAKALAAKSSAVSAAAASSK